VLSAAIGILYNGGSQMIFLFESQKLKFFGCKMPSGELFNKRPQNNFVFNEICTLKAVFANI
jgi:hypothetical protein